MGVGGNGAVAGLKGSFVGLPQKSWRGPTNGFRNVGPTIGLLWVFLAILLFDPKL